MLREFLQIHERDFAPRRHGVIQRRRAVAVLRHKTRDRARVFRVRHHVCQCFVRPLSDQRVPRRDRCRGPAAHHLVEGLHEPVAVVRPQDAPTMQREELLGEAVQCLPGVAPCLLRRHGTIQRCESLGQARAEPRPHRDIREDLAPAHAYGPERARPVVHEAAATFCIRRTIAPLREDLAQIGREPPLRRARQHVAVGLVRNVGLPAIEEEPRLRRRRAAHGQRVEHGRTPHQAQQRRARDRADRFRETLIQEPRRGADRRPQGFGRRHRRDRAHLEDPQLRIVHRPLDIHRRPHRTLEDQEPMQQFLGEFRRQRLRAIVARCRVNGNAGLGPGISERQMETRRRA